MMNTIMLYTPPDFKSALQTRKRQLDILQKAELLRRKQVLWKEIRDVQAAAVERRKIFEARINDITLWVVTDFLRTEYAAFKVGNEHAEAVAKKLQDAGWPVILISEEYSSWITIQTDEPS
jgi:hypothetical protein